MFLIIFIFNFILGIKVDIFGPICLFDGLGQSSTSLYNACKLIPNIKCNLIENEQNYLSDADFLIYNGDLQIIPESFKNINKKQKRICYFFIESTIISDENVFKLNNYFDYILIPSSWIKDVLINSGVKKPFFKLSMPLENSLIKDFKKNKSYQKNKDKIIFGFSSAPWPRKNISKLINAFKKAFNNNENVELHIHMKFFDAPDLKLVTNKIKEEAFDDTRVKLFTDVLTKKEYLKFIASLDFYVSLSMAEGYGIGFREALLIGVPCILTDNTAQSDLINLSGVIKVESKELVKAQSHDNLIYPMFGYQFDCDLNEAASKLKYAYSNYNLYKLKDINYNFNDVGFSLQVASKKLAKIFKLIC